MHSAYLVRNTYYLHIHKVKQHDIPSTSGYLQGVAWGLIQLLVVALSGVCFLSICDLMSPKDKLDCFPLVNFSLTFVRRTIVLD